MVSTLTATETDIMHTTITVDTMERSMLVARTTMHLRARILARRITERTMLGELAEQAVLLELRGQQEQAVLEELQGQRVQVVLQHQRNPKADLESAAEQAAAEVSL
jgi:hypothetical protein